MRVLITRPAEDARPLADSLRALGHQPAIEPLLDIRIMPDAPLDLDGVQGLLFTSANGVRAFAARSAVRDLPVYAVGDASARAAVEAGFERVESAGGDVADLARLVIAQADPKAGALLHVAASQLAGDLAGDLAKAGFTVRRAVLYEAIPAIQLGRETLAALREGRLDAALFFSPRTAATFATLIDQAAMAATLKPLTAFALSPAVADKLAGFGFGAIRVAERPDQDSLLALLQEFAMNTPTPEAEAPKPAKKSGAGSIVLVWLLVLAAALAVGTLALGPKVNDLFRQTHSDDQATETRLELIERRLATIETALATQAKRLDETAKLAGAGLAPTPPNTQLEDQVARLTARLESAERALAEVAAKRETNPALLLAIGQVREAARSGQPYASELAVARLAASTDAAILALLDGLAPSAERGLPTLAALKRAFEAAKPSILKEAAPADADWKAKTLDRLSKLVTVRRIGETAPPESADGAVARAEAALARDDLAAAAGALANLEGPAAEAAKPWLAEAARRLEGERRLSELASRAAAQAARAGTP